MYLKITGKYFIYFAVQVKTLQAKVINHLLIIKWEILSDYFGIIITFYDH